MIRTASIPFRHVPARHHDERGWFSELYSRKAMAECGVGHDFVQDNFSHSVRRGTIRGIHFQRPPHGQAKLVRCLAGAILDVAVDLRAGSPSYGQWVSAVLTSEGGEQLYIPEGFGHGFMTLTDNAAVSYLASDHYHPDLEGGIAWDDSDLSIAWPLAGLTPTLSPKDRSLPPLRDIVSGFAYDGVPLAPLE
ncbi:MAG TPA: dTDP-4-dehydrorhamnose 3,5-epimerase [Novosphingobium sp.]|nr:dTDP-4-dehydrorhamnose 3,5-epimerase [Novosphingobium sp.]